MRKQFQNFSGDGDKCACKIVPNGVWTTIVLNILLWTAVVFSGGAVLDCRMVEADIFPATGTVNWPALPANLVGLTDGQPADRRGFGFFIHEDASGRCRWDHWHDNDDDLNSEDMEDEVEDYVEEYVDWMGSDWRKAAKVAVSASSIGFGLAVAASIYFCVAHVKAIRYVCGIFVVIVIVPLQFAALSVMDSEFCEGRNCKLQRSGSFAILAGMLYLLGGATFFLLKNYTEPPNDSSNMETVKEAPVIKAVAVEEITHQEEDVEYTADYALDTVETGDVPKNEPVGDGMEVAQDIEPAQIY